MATINTPYLIYVGLGLLLLVLQGTILAKLGGVSLLPILVVHLSVTRNFAAGSLIALGLGLVQDLISGFKPGLAAMIYLIIFHFAYLAYRRFNFNHPLHQLGVALISLAFYQVVVAYFGTGLLPSVRVWVGLTMATALSPFLFQFLNRIELWWSVRLLQNRSRRQV